MSTTKASRPIHPLSCPFCAGEVEVAEHELIDGGSVTCPHCREEAVLARERVEHSLHDQWLLAEPSQSEDEGR